MGPPASLGIYSIFTKKKIGAEGGGTVRGHIFPKFHFVVGKHDDGFPAGAGLCGSRWHLQR